MEFAWGPRDFRVPEIRAQALHTSSGPGKVGLPHSCSAEEVQGIAESCSSSFWLLVFAIHSIGFNFQLRICPQHLSAPPPPHGGTELLWLQSHSQV